jgi:aryl-alcohol dehydrogenase-like predicted oxidoreductase
MRFRQLGRSGLTVSTVGLGCNNFGMRLDADGTRAVVEAALEQGITFYDTAEMYGGGKSEEFLGAALGSRRDEVIIATKFGTRADGQDRASGSRRSIIRSCEGSLRRLGTDHIDLYYQHYPDPRTPIEETLEALAALVAQGKVRYIASSNVAGWQVAEADHTAREQHLHRFVGCQLEWNLLQRDAEKELVPACRRYGVGVVPYFPLASGLLTGKYRRDKEFPADSRLAAIPYFASVASDENFDTVDRLTAVAEERGHTILDLALSWLLAQEGVASVLTGATKPEQIAANVGAAEWRLTGDDLEAVGHALANDAADG